MNAHLEILIVDDDIDLTASLRDILEMNGYGTAVAHDGETALALCRDKVFNLGIIDLKLPDISGIELIDDLAKLCDEMEYIISTGYASMDSAVDAVSQKKVIAYQLKPFNMDHLLAIIMQVAERRKAEGELQRLLENESKSAREWQELFDASIDEISLLSPDFEILRINRAGCERLGKKPEEIIGKKCYEVVYGLHRPIDNCPCEDIVRTNRAGTGEIKYNGKCYLITGSPIVSENGELLAFTHVAKDITEQKQLEEERRRAEKLESVGTLAGGIAHDFNNLLTGVIGNITLAKRYLEPKSKAGERLTAAEKAALKARGLTQQLLTFARGGIPVRKVSSITELIKDTATFILRGSNVKCELSLPGDIWPVEVDEVQMTQVINNLAINAGEAMPEGGTIHIEAKNTVVEGDALPLPAGKYVEITVEDHGIGIEKEHLSRIFEPYFTTKLKGSGLGLATTYSIIKNHDGYITVESEVGAGTTFHIYLPASKRPIPAKKREEAVQSAFPGRGKILVMDDEEVIREMLSKMLPLAGYEVELVKDGAEAIERYVKAEKAGQPFDAVIMDLTVPGGMGGREAIKELLEIAPAAKVIVSSGYATDSVMADYKQYGFSAIAAKPYSAGDLERILHNILKK